MNKRSRILLSTSSLALMVSLAACAPAMPGEEESAKGTTKLIVAPSSEMSAAWAQFAVAEDQGFFSDNGIDVEVQFPGGSSDVLQQMASGRVQIGGPTPEAVLAAKAKGQDVEMIYNWARSPVQWLAVAPDSSITSFDGLAGKKVGVATLASGAKILAEAAAKDQGVEPTDITFVATGTGVAALDALRKGRVDALMLWDTEYTKMKQAGGELRFVEPDAYQELFSTTFAAQAGWAEKNPQLVQAFGKAWAEATVWATKNPEGAVQLLWEYYPQTKISTDAKALSNNVELFKGRNAVALSGDPIGSKTLGEYPPKGVAKWVEFAHEFKIIDQTLEADSVYSNDHVEAYNDFDVKAVEDKAASFTAK